MDDGKGRLRKVRLDELLVARGLAENRPQAQRLIMAGQALLDEQVADKPGRQVSEDAAIRVKRGLPYVSRGGLKLAAALAAFGVDPAGWVCADIGASTGGFTDCLLQRGAVRVYAVDVGYGQLAWSLRQDPRVVALERVNIRHLTSLPESVALATIDVSFIGLGLVLPRVAELLAPEGQVIALIKPQFEVGKGQVGKGGVVRDPALHRAVIERVLREAAGMGLAPAGVIRSPITGPAGNVEFLAWLRLGAVTPPADVVAQWAAGVMLSEGLDP
ncbi:MAG: TlyA family rRNA (cytidine-2'-O)-methyltransferase [Anaerolineae bacterium CG2_30_64_16]|nr:MAG: TlyA family rRNA (cytidine-2'-O)-methyltransferase [Anaerolineae bacterium CG2_30_64_16]